VLLAAVAGALWTAGLFDGREPVQVAEGPGPSHSPKLFPFPPIAASPYRNTGSEARYVGSAACAACHPDRSASFRKTGMGVSMAAVDPAAEPPDAAFDHASSKRHYEVVRKGGNLWHREVDARGESTEFPLRYAVGSGRHAKTYLAEADGFLVESPVTWYASRQAWSMSPGYDRPDHMGFERPVGENCLFCHAGRAEAIGKSQHRMSVIEPAIGCERCHGPGSLHAERHRAAAGDAAVGGDFDDTIVNPRRLARDLADAICHQCHLMAPAMAFVRGRSHSDFRPGLPLEDFRTDYRLEVEDRPMTVTGHVEQLLLSRCYMQSATLTCITCHDPHGFPEPANRARYYRDRCLDCHAVNGCKVTKEVLARESPDNDCAKCHMPRTPTEVPHVSLTHHRIGLHRPAAAPEKSEAGKVGTLRPIRESPRLQEIDRELSLGLAYFELARDAAPRDAAHYQLRGAEILMGVRAAGLTDPVMATRLARYFFERGSPEALPLAEAAIGSDRLGGVDRCGAIFVAAAEDFRNRRYEAARSRFRELVTLRRHPHDWLLLAECEKALGHRAASEEAIRQARRIQPGLQRP
jgi:hypothetical protein